MLHPKLLLLLPMASSFLAVLILIITPIQCRPIEDSSSEQENQPTNEQTSGGSVLESTVFIVGICAGVFGFIAISCAICLCVFLMGRHGIPQTLSLRASTNRKKDLPVLLSPSNKDEIPRSYCDDRVSFMRSSVSRDISFQALENLELEKIIVGPCLGRGAYGKVYKGEYAGIQLAIKVCEHDGAFLRNGNEPLETYLSRNIHHDNVVKTLVNETRRRCSFQATTSEASLLNHPLAQLSQSTEPKISSSSGGSSDEFSYIARTMETPSGDDAYRTWIIMEYCEMGSLDQAIKDRVFFNGQSMSEPNFHHMFLSAIDIADAMKYLHQQRIVHGDLKSQNVLLKKSSVDQRGFYCKVGDFGLSRVIANKTHIDTFTCGTVSHSAPELFRRGLLTPAADVYSFAILLWELVTGTKAFNGSQHNAIVMAVTGGCRPIIPSYCPVALTRLINDCWQDSYTDRPTFKTISSRLRLMLDDETTFLSSPQFRSTSIRAVSPNTRDPTQQTGSFSQEGPSETQDPGNHDLTIEKQEENVPICHHPEKRITAILRNTDWKSDDESIEEEGNRTEEDMPDDQWHSACETITQSYSFLPKENSSDEESPATILSRSLSFSLPSRSTSRDNLGLEVV